MTEQHDEQHGEQHADQRDQQTGNGNVPPAGRSEQTALPVPPPAATAPAAGSVREPGVAALALEVEQLRATVRELRGLEEQVRRAAGTADVALARGAGIERVRQQVEQLTRLVGQLAHRIGILAGAGRREGELGPVNWLVVGADEAAAILPGLVEWVEAVYVSYAEVSEPGELQRRVELEEEQHVLAAGRDGAPSPPRTIRYAFPNCWPVHGDVVQELLWLRGLWLHAFESAEGTTRDVADWHDRWLPGVARRVKVRLQGCAVAGSHTHGRPLQRVGRARLEDFARNWGAMPAADRLQGTHRFVEQPS